MVKGEDKIADVLKKFPYIREKLIGHNKIFAKLNNTLLFNTIGRFARISDVAERSGEKRDDLIRFINDLIKSEEKSLVIE